MKKRLNNMAAEGSPIPTDHLFHCNRRLARQKWGPAINRDALEILKSFSEDFRFSISSGDLLFLDRGWYVTHVGLIRLARRNRCHGSWFNPCVSIVIPRCSVGHSKQRCTSLERVEASSASATPIPPTFRSSYTAQRCASPKRALSTALCERPTASASARSRRLVPWLANPLHVQTPGSCRSLQMATGTSAGARSVIVFAN